MNFYVFLKCDKKYQKFYNTIDKEIGGYQTLRQVASSWWIDDEQEKKVPNVAAKWNGLRVLLEEEMQKKNKVLLFGVYVKTVKWLKT